MPKNQIDRLSNKLVSILNKHALLEEDFESITNILTEGVQLVGVDFIYTENRFGAVASDIAAEYGAVKCLQSIIDIQNNPAFGTPNDGYRRLHALFDLHVACVRGHEECVELILANNTKECFYTNGVPRKDFAIDGFTERDLNTAMMHAIRACATGCIRAIINHEKKTGINIAELYLTNAIQVAFTLAKSYQKKNTKERLGDNPFIKISNIIEEYRAELYREPKAKPRMALS